MSADQQFESTVERMVAMLRAELERQAADAAHAAAAERERAVRQATDAARQQAQDQLAQVQHAAETQIAALRKQLEEVRRAAQEQLDSVRRAAQADAAARARAEAQVEDVRRIGRGHVEEVQRTMSDRLSAMSRELDEARRALADRRHELDAVGDQSAASLNQLARALQTVDDADSLSDVFRRLIDAARDHADGAAVLLVREGGLREWAKAGSEQGDSASAGVDSLASAAVNERRTVESDDAIAYPIIVGGDVVAVLHARVGDALSPRRGISNHALGVLTRHACRVLETITLEQAVGLRGVQREPADSGRSIVEGAS